MTYERLSEIASSTRNITKLDTMCNSFACKGICNNISCKTCPMEGRIEQLRKAEAKKKSLASA